MKNSLSLLSFCLILLVLGLSSCKKEYTCRCTYANTLVYDNYTFYIKDTKSNAYNICFNETVDPAHNIDPVTPDECSTTLIK